MQNPNSTPSSEDAPGHSETVMVAYEGQFGFRITTQQPMGERVVVEVATVLPGGWLSILDTDRLGYLPPLTRAAHIKQYTDKVVPLATDITGGAL